MSGMPLITDIGLQKIALAAGEGPVVRVTEVALGDGGGASYNPDFDQVALVNELLRRDIATSFQVDVSSWMIRVLFPADDPAVEVREIGFFDQDGDMIVVFAGVDMPARRTGAADYEIDQVLDFSRVGDGLIIVDAPLDVAFSLAVGQALTKFQLMTEQLRQALVLETL